MQFLIIENKLSFLITIVILFGFALTANGLYYQEDESNFKNLIIKNILKNKKK